MRLSKRRENSKVPQNISLDVGILREKAKQANDLEEFFHSLGLSMKNVLTERALQTGGPGGQHANKVATSIRITVYLDKLPSHLADALQQRYPGYVGEKENTFSVNCGIHRSQLQNRTQARQDIFDKIQHVLEEEKVRNTGKPTSVTKMQKNMNKKERQKGREKRQRRQKGFRLLDN